MEEETELDFATLCMQLVAVAGEAKSVYVECIESARSGDFDGAEERWVHANDVFLEAHNAHFELLRSELAATGPMEQILEIHAEDQLADAETYKLLSNELMNLYKRLS